MTVARPPCRTIRISPETCCCVSSMNASSDALERREPHAVVDQLGPALLDVALEPRLLALDRDVLELLVRGDERHRARRLVDLAAT